MLNGKTLVELAQAVQDASARKVDVVADTRNLTVQAHPEGVKLVIAGREESPVLTDHALSQVTDRVGIPAKYAERMRQDAPALFEQNINHWFREESELRMVRMVKNGHLKARAFLSNRYQRIDHDRLLSILLPELTASDLIVRSTDLTESRMYIKVIYPDLSGEIRVGDVVRYGFSFGNSEIGKGRYTLVPFMERLRCTNGMVIPVELDDRRIGKTHVGRALSEGEMRADYLSDEAIEADDKAIALVLRDTLRAFADRSRFESVLERMRAAASSTAATDPVVTAERIADTLALPKPEANGVLTAFLRDADYTKWGLANAVTNVANTSASYDRAAELEAIGGRILTLADSEWRRLAA